MSFHETSFFRPSKRSSTVNGLSVAPSDLMKLSMASRPIVSESVITATIARPKVPPRARARGALRAAHAQRYLFTYPEVAAAARGLRHTYLPPARGTAPA